MLSLLEGRTTKQIYVLSSSPPGLIHLSGFDHFCYFICVSSFHTLQGALGGLPSSKLAEDSLRAILLSRTSLFLAGLLLSR